MQSFMQYLNEAADSTINLHMTHTDEDLYERGDKGAQAAIDYLEDIVETLGKGRTKLTVKWDGAPAIFAGWDPKDNKFFVGTKSVFNKNPKIYKTDKDITSNEKGGKADKLRWALKELPKVGIPKNTVLQGDMMFTKGDQKYETIEGKRWITVHPNTIVYAWPADSSVGADISNANMGIVWHTTYTGRDDLSKYRARFGVDVSKLKKTRTVWQDDAYFKGADVAFTEAEYKSVLSHLAKAKALVGGFDKLTNLMDNLPSQAVGAGIKTYINSKIRQGNMDISAKEYAGYVGTWWTEKIIDKVKQEKTKEVKRAALRQFMDDLKSNWSELDRSLKFVGHITEAKMIVVKKLNAINKQKSFVLTSDGFEVTDPEGFVAINSEKGEAVKLVDRLTFSHMNFNDRYVKGWQR